MMKGGKLGGYELSPSLRADRGNRNNLAVFILTIDAQHGVRRISATQELMKSGLEGVFVEGFSKDNKIILTEYSSGLNVIANKRGLTEGEIAVYCGHRDIWQRFLKSGADHALILEDDFKVVDPDAFGAALEDCLGHGTEWGMAKFFDFQPKHIKRRKFLGRTELVRYKYTASGAVAYLINRDTARRLLSRGRFFRAVDEDFSWGWELGLDIWSVFPNPIADGGNILGGSLLEADRVSKKTRRNPIRSIWGNVLQGYKLLRSLGA